MARWINILKEALSEEKSPSKLTLSSPPTSCHDNHKQRTPSQQCYPHHQGQFLARAPSFTGESSHFHPPVPFSSPPPTFAPPKSVNCTSTPTSRPHFGSQRQNPSSASSPPPISFPTPRTPGTPPFPATRSSTKMAGVSTGTRSVPASLRAYRPIFAPHSRARRRARLSAATIKANPGQ
jgi:hypothetical protein